MTLIELIAQAQLALAEHGDCIVKTEIADRLFAEAHTAEIDYDIEGVQFFHVS